MIVLRLGYQEQQKPYWFLLKQIYDGGYIEPSEPITMNTPQTSHQAEVIKRLARVEGQIRGIQKLIVAESDCEKILQQMTAARRALDKAFFDMLACVIEANVVEEADTKPVAERMAEVKALLTRYA